MEIQYLSNQDSRIIKKTCTYAKTSGEKVECFLCIHVNQCNTGNSACTLVRSIRVYGVYAQMSVTTRKIISLWGSLQLTEPKKKKLFLIKIKGSNECDGKKKEFWEV